MLRASAAHRGHDVVTRGELGDVRPDRLDTAEVLMADGQKVVAVGCGTVFAGIDLLVGAVDAAAQEPHEYAAAVWNVL